MAFDSSSAAPVLEPGFDASSAKPVLAQGFDPGAAKPVVQSSPLQRAPDELRAATPEVEAQIKQDDLDQAQTKKGKYGWSPAEWNASTIPERLGLMWRGFVNKGYDQSVEQAFQGPNIPRVEAPQGTDIKARTEQAGAATANVATGAASGLMTKGTASMLISPEAALYAAPYFINQGLKGLQKAFVGGEGETTQQRMEEGLGGALMFTGAFKGGAHVLKPEVRAAVDQTAAQFRDQASQTDSVADKNLLTTAANHVEQIEKPHEEIAQGKPLPDNAKITHMSMGGKTATQIDIPHPDDPNARPIFSGSPEDARAAGYNIDQSKFFNAGAAKPVTTETQTTEAGTSEKTVGEAPAAGLGAASPQEFKPIGHSITSIQNSFTDMERTARGVPPAMEMAARHDPDVWNEAMQHIDQNPQAGENLVKEINAKPRAVSDVENDILAHHQIDLQNEFDKVNERINTGTGSDVTLDADKTRRDELSQQLQDTYDATRATGRQQGLSLRSRQMLFNEDFSLARMETTRRAQNDGAPLTDKQAAETQSLHEDITRTGQALDEARAKQEQSASEQQADETIKGLKQKVTSEAPGAAPDPDAYFQATIDKIKDRVNNDGGPKSIQPFIKRLAEYFVRAGVTEREALVDAVHGEIKDIIPDMSRRDTLDAIAGYGDWKPLNPDPIKAKLRDLQGQLQQVAKLEDFANGKKLKKSGVQYRQPSAEEMKLQNQLSGLVRMDQVQPRSFQSPGEKIPTDPTKGQFQPRSFQPGPEENIPTDPYKGKVIPREYPASQEEAELQAIARVKERLRNQTADYQDRLANSDFGPRPKPVAPMETPEIAKLRADDERAKQAFQDALDKDKQAQRSVGQKIWDGFVNLRRIGLISGIKTFGKIAIAGEGRIAMTSAESMAGEALRRVPGIKDIAEGAPRQGGTTGQTFQKIAKGYVEGWQYAMQQAVNVLKTGKTDAEINAGQRAYPPTLLHYLANTHALLKLPAFAQEYKISLRERVAWENQHGTDMDNPVNQIRVNNEAVNDGLRAKFQNDNILSSRLNMLYNSLRNSKQHPTAAAAIEGVMRFAMPIVHIPTNYFAESATYNNFGLGLPRAAIKTIQALKNGVDKLEPAQADSIMRHWKKGALGAGLMLYGFYNRKDIGGYYQPGKQPPGQTEFGGAKIGGVDIPRWMIHLPIMEPIHFGATVGHVLDHITKKTGEAGTLGDGVMAGVAGLLDEMPYVSNARNITESLAPGAQGKYARGELAKSATVPQVLSDIATMTDTDSSGKPVKRAPKTMTQHVETGIPLLRENVPIKH